MRISSICYGALCTGKPTTGRLLRHGPCRLGFLGTAAITTARQSISYSKKSASRLTRLLKFARRTIALATSLGSSPMMIYRRLSHGFSSRPMKNSDGLAIHLPRCLKPSAVWSDWLEAPQKTGALLLHYRPNEVCVLRPRATSFAIRSADFRRATFGWQAQQADVPRPAGHGREWLF